MKKDSTIKIVGVAALVIIALWVLKAILFPMGYGVSMNYAIPTHMGNSFNYSYGFNNFSGSVTLLIGFLIRILLIVFVVALFVGLAMLVKQHVFTQEDINDMKNTFTGKSEKADKVCSVCDKTLDEEWKICPHCGNEVDKH